MRNILTLVMYAVMLLSMGSLAPDQTAGSIARADELRSIRPPDTCWWWGARWQYGWRGYGWYWCFEAPDSLDAAVMPKAQTNAETAATGSKSCVQRWRDEAGSQRSRRVC